MNMQIGQSFKYAKFGRGSVVMHARGAEPLLIDEIARHCPSVLAEAKHESRSERYQFISTYDLLRGLAKEDFHPHFIMQGGSKDEAKRGFTKHLIRFRSSASKAINAGGSTYEVCLLNSHDGTTSEQMYGGFFRFACKNGTIFFDGEASCIKVPHKGNVLDQVVEAAYTIVGNGKLSAEHVENFRTIDLKPAEQLALASSAAELRFGDEAPVEPAQLLTARRPEDNGSDLWSVFNRVQESTLRGGLHYTETREDDRGRQRQIHRHTRPVRSVDGDVKLNRALWVLAEEMAKLKAA